MKPLCLVCVKDFEVNGAMKKLLIVFFACFLLLFPAKKGLAVEFSITDAKIDAYLQKNGDVAVKETFTYDFDSKFRGITREIVPKKGASIKDFAAFEKGKPLKVEKEGDVYKIYRSGKKEKITVELRYRITGGMEKYEDGVQFYWPFFDERNESDYLRMTIAVHPPEAADQVLALGYDEAYGKEDIRDDGTVVFRLGEVPAGENGDIRVIYEPELFPGMGMKAGTIREKVLKEKEHLAEKAKKYAETRDALRKAGNGLIPAMLVFFAVLFPAAFLSSRRKKRLVEEHLERLQFHVPEEKLSIPATIYFTSGCIFKPETAAAALYDLLRKGYVKQETEDRFVLVNGRTEHPHERKLIRFLFEQVGNGKEFSLKELKKFTNNRKNLEIYQSKMMEWKRKIAEEVKQAGLYETKAGLRWGVAAVGVLLGISAVFFGIYELYVPFIGTLLGSAAALLFAIFYHPKSDKGLEILLEWQRLRERLRHFTKDQWDLLSDGEKQRLIAYGIGVDNAPFKKAFNAFLEAEKRSFPEGTGFLSNPAYTVAIFTAADSRAGAFTGGASGSSGGGVGGGGGGSGAF